MIDTEVRRLHSDRDIDGLADLSADLRQEIQRLTAENERYRKALQELAVELPVVWVRELISEALSQEKDDE